MNRHEQARLLKKKLVDRLLERSCPSIQYRLLTETEKQCRTEPPLEKCMSKSCNFSIQTMKMDFDSWIVPKIGCNGSIVWS